MDNKIWSITEITQTIKGLLEESFYPLWISGEIGNLTIHRSGHVYLTLKDKRCQLSCVFFNGADNARQLGIEEGVEVEVFGKLMVYEPRGNYQLSIRQMRARGIGALQQQFDQLKQKLQAEGLFDEERKKDIPFLPKSIGIITSSDGAALRDFLNIINRRFSSMHVRIYPASVQGPEAAGQITAGLRYFNTGQKCDVIVVTRGGGSLEDLWAFNEELLARAISESDIPVISAVGHEIDFTICDFVADLRVPTPSAAAELVVGKKEELLTKINGLQIRLSHSMKFKLSTLKARVERVAHHYILKEPINMVRIFQQKVDELNLRLNNELDTTINRKKQILSRLNGQLRVLNPCNVLSRGYSILLTEDGSTAITSDNQVNVGSNVLAKLADGELNLTVKEIKGRAD